MSNRSFGPIRTGLLASAALLAGFIGFAADPPAAPVGKPLEPAESLRRLKVPDDLAVDQVLTEPGVRQPVSISFDERGRMWVVQYIQYPSPAGLTIVSRDHLWRVIYDKVPAAPGAPGHVPGADKITIHEDADGDSTFEKSTTFLEGLNVATAAVPGRGGVFVLNPPYLLFYPVKPGTDTPAEKPDVLLQGFGLEDSHAVANSLRWGPDGWLYGAQGSTVTGGITRPGSKAPPTRADGQLIWRYHPGDRTFEVFAEGGGNAFGVEFDARGRLYSGHNGGNTRGFHYVQGGYYQKWFEKHGPMSNPYTFGFFESMKHNTASRFSHTFAVNDAPGLPAKYRGHLFAADPIAGKVIESEMTPNGSTWRTKDIGTTLGGTDPWFRPVDVKFGPDGALYVADWYDGQVNHYRNHEGKMDHETGRVYRVRAKDAKPLAPFDLGKKTTPELIALLRHEGKWHRDTARRLLADRQDPMAVDPLRKLLAAETGRTALEALWALHVCRGFTGEAALAALDHAEPAVREWAVRLLGDPRRVDPKIATRLAQLAATEPDLEVRSQLACTARRLPAADGLPVVRQLLLRDADPTDPHVPLLLWWAVEAKSGDRDAVLGLFAERVLWTKRAAGGLIAPNLLRRFAIAGGAEDLKACVKLFRQAPSPEAGKRLLTGFEAAFQGRSVVGLPVELIEEVTKLGGGSVSFGVRLGRPEAIDKALAVISDPKAKARDRVDCLEAFGEVSVPSAVPALLSVACQNGSAEVRSAALMALQRYDATEIGTRVIAALPKFPADVQPAALGLLVGRKGWALELADAVASDKVGKGLVPPDVVRRLAAIPDPKVAAAVKRAWGEVKGATTAQMQKEIERVSGVLGRGVGDPVAGKAVFVQKCAACHKLFGSGGAVGPDLTAFKRDDLPTMLLSVVNPSAEIREGFENHVVQTASERRVSGLLIEKDPKKLVLRTADGQRVVIDRAEVDSESVSGVSLMPEGLLDGLTDQQLRDLFGYLRATQPVLK